MTETISQIYVEHKGYISDKWSSYLPVYDRWLATYKNSSINLLEIGVQNGGSLQIWAKFFTHAQKIVGCDVNPACADLIYDDLRIALVLGDIKAESVREQVLAHSPVYDIIVDDGSHKSADIVKTFQYFYSRLARGGLYVIEDLHCSYWSKWQGGLWRSDSAMEFFKSLTDVINLDSWGVNNLSQERVGKLNSSIRFRPVDFQDIESISFYKSMCLIVKGHGLNSLGGRVVAGEEAIVQQILSEPGSRLHVPFQMKNLKKLKLKK